MTSTSAGDGAHDPIGSAGRRSAIPKAIRPVLRRRWLVPAWALLASVILVFGSMLSFNSIDNRLANNQLDADAVLVSIHRGPFLWGWQRVSFEAFPSSPGGGPERRSIVATLHTGSSDVERWQPGTHISISYNADHPSAVVYYGNSADFDDNREDALFTLSLLAILAAAGSLIALVVRIIGRGRYKRCFAAGNDAIPATFLDASRKWRVTRYELETPAEVHPSRLAVRLLGGQDIKLFTPGERLDLHSSPDGTGAVAMASAGWERILLGRGSRESDSNLLWAHYVESRVDRSDVQIAGSKHPRWRAINDMPAAARITRLVSGKGRWEFRDESAVVLATQIGDELSTADGSYKFTKAGLVDATSGVVVVPGITHPSLKEYVRRIGPDRPRGRVDFVDGSWVEFRVRTDGHMLRWNIGTIANQSGETVLTLRWLADDLPRHYGVVGVSGDKFKRLGEAVIAPDVDLPVQNILLTAFAFAVFDSLSTGGGGA